MHRISCDLDQTQKRHFRLGEQLESKSRLLQESAERERQVGCALQQEREKLRVAKEDVRQTYVDVQLELLRILILIRQCNKWNKTGTLWRIKKKYFLQFLM